MLSVRTVAGEYLVAMKLRSGRKYKFDLSDVIGIVNWHQKNSDPITLERIKQAATELYGSWDELPEFSKVFAEKLFDGENYDKVIERLRAEAGKTIK